MTPPAEVVVLDGPAILANARALGAVLRGAANENERRRRLTPRTVDALRSSGVFRMPMPRAWGGPEVDPWTQVEIIEALSHADGSAGWCAMIGCAGGYYTANLDDEVARALYPDLDAVTAGWVMPGGRLRPVEGGYRLTGRWQFASGCTHADVMIAGATVLAPQPSAGAGQPPQLRIAVLPADRVEIIDTWDPTGLVGSGSHDYAVEDVFVPAEHTFWWGESRRAGPLYAWPGLFTVPFLGVPLGVARAALDAAERILQDKVVIPEMRPARDEPRVRVAVARAEALIGSARSYALDVVGDIWSTLVAAGAPATRQRGALAGCFLHTARTCRDAVELLADAVGTSAVFRRCPLERHRRDLTTLCLHVTAQPRFLEVVGGFWIEGADIDHPLVAGRVF